MQATETYGAVIDIIWVLVMQKKMQQEYLVQVAKKDSCDGNAYLLPQNRFKTILWRK